MQRTKITKAILAVLTAGMIMGAVFPVAAEKHETIRLIKALRSDNLGRRVSAAQKLAENREVKAVKPLIRMLKNDLESFARFSAAVALAQISDKKALKALKYSTRYDRNENVRTVSGDAIFEIERLDLILAVK